MFGFSICASMRFTFCVFFFFFDAHVSGDREHCVTHCSCIVHGTHNHFIQKNIKNGSHGIIHTFKNYFAIVFWVFSKIKCIQMDPRYELTPNTLYNSKTCQLFDIWMLSQMTHHCSRPEFLIDSKNSLKLCFT